MPEPTSEYVGLLLIGDPHLEGRSPGFRRDDYPRVILDKLTWCIDYARTNRLLPALLGDLFDKPRDNPTWMMGQLLDLLGSVECVGIYGNHDCADPQLGDHDSLSLLVKAGRLRLLDDRPWEGVINGRRLVVGGSSYRQALPTAFVMPPDKDNGPPVVVWLTHHDLIVPGYEEQGRHKTREIAGVDLVVNGHIHRRLQDVQSGSTLWMTPGNISRRSRSDATREHRPSVLRIDVGATGYERTFVELAHQPFEDVFHPQIVVPELDAVASTFVAGLAELQARRTESGAGLITFLNENLGQFDAAVAAEIRTLAEEVTNDAKQNVR